MTDEGTQWRPHREINRLEGQGWGASTVWEEVGQENQRERLKPVVPQPGSQKLKGGEKMWSVPPEVTMEPRHVSEEANEKSGAHQGFCLVAANQGRAENTKAPVGTTLLSSGHPNTRWVLPRSLQFNKAFLFL